ncbi:MAG: hypothetical protein ABI698_03580 [bacterium]
MLKLSQALAFVPAHLGEFRRSGFAGIIAPVHVTVGLLSEIVPAAGVALNEAGTNNILAAQAAKHKAVSSASLNLKLNVKSLEFCSLRYMVALLQNGNMVEVGGHPITGSSETTQLRTELVVEELATITLTI